jgi:tetratricopeptide (TPR) repeat protein
MQNVVAREAVAKAVEMHERALAIYEELDDPAGQADILQCLAKCYRSLGDDGKALQLMQRSLQLLQAFAEPGDDAE